MRTPALLLFTALLLAGCATTPATKSPSSTPPAPAAPAFDPKLAIPATDDGLPGNGPIRRYDWFQKLWQERRNKWAAQVQQDQRAVVFLGDSITQGWHDDLDGLFPELKVANRGISGDTTRGVLIRLQEDVIALHPRAVVLLIGTNDLDEKGGNPWEVASNIRLIIDELRRADPAMPVVVCQVMPSSPQKNRPAHLIRRINQMIIELTADQPQVTVLDTWKLFAGPDNNAPVELFPDLLHPNNLGYAKWANALRPVLATLGLVERENDEFTIENDFVALFNGHDLTGWGYHATSPEDLENLKKWQAGQADAPAGFFVKEAVKFDGLTATPDGRYVAKSGRLTVTTPSGGRRIQQLWTTQEFPKNFVLRLQFRATPNADSGVYVRGPQLQCRDYLLAGPYTKLQKYRAQDWNDLEITVKNGTAYCTCNGEVLEEAMQVPDTGPIGLEGDRGQVEYRRIRLMELPAQ
ncbi:MAG: GDSL-type esterase/lipase family protein [Lacunisphaera sp.]